MINMRIVFDFIMMMLINHISNMHSNRFLKNNFTFYTFFGYPNLYKQVKVDELLNILHFQYNVVFKCTCKFSTFKYYRKIHQTPSEKVGLNSILLVIFKHTCYLFLLCQSFSNFVITSLETQRKALYFYQVLSIYFLLLVSKNGPFFYSLGNNYFSCIFYHVFT